MTAFAVDLDQLTVTVATLTDTARRCDVALDLVSARVARLQDTWSGQTAAAQAEAQARWESGFGSMTEGLSAMRAAAQTAESNYRAAVDVNVRLWSL